LICSARLRGQAVLQVDRGERGRELAQIGGGRADLARQLAEAPVRRRDGRIGAGQDQRQPLGIVAVCLDMDERALDHARPAAFGTPAHRTRQLAKREKALVIGPREPLRRDPADPLPAETSTL
jgi:hypothetical protein